MDEEDVIARLHGWLRGRSVDRILANWEPLVIVGRAAPRALRPAGDVGRRGARLPRQAADEGPRRGGRLRVPRAQRVRSVKEVWSAVEVTVFPAIIKPISGAGSADTYKVESAKDMERVLPHMLHVDEANLRGVHRRRGVHVRHGVDRRQPRVRERDAVLPERARDAFERVDISPIMLSVRDLDQPHIQKGIELGRQVLRTLGMGDGMTHMEWFLTLELARWCSARSRAGRVARAWSIR